MKKKIISCITAAVLLSASVMPAAAADPAPAETADAASSGTEDEAASAAEPEEEKAPTVEERVAAALEVYQRELAHCDQVKPVSETDTILRWNTYIEEFNTKYLGALDADTTLKELIFEYLDSPYHSDLTTGDQILEGPAPAVTDVTAPAVTTTAVTTVTETETTVCSTVTSGYKGIYDNEIPREYVRDVIVKRIKEVMPPEHFEAMVKDPDVYHLYFLDGSIIVAVNNAHTGAQLLDNVQLVLDIIQLDPISVAWDLNALSATTVTERLYDVVMIMNERNRELAEIEYEMTKMGLWNVNDEETTIPNNVKPGSGRPRMPKPSGTDGADETNAPEQAADENPHAPFENVEDMLDRLPRLVYDLTSGNDTYRVLDTDEPVYGIIDEQGAGETGDDTLFYDYDLDPADLEFLRIDGDLFINDPVHETYIILKCYFSNPAKRVENIKFNDGSIMCYADVCDITNTFVGTKLNDNFEGYPERNFMWGKEGDDSLCGNYGDDCLLGYAGNDNITLARHCFGLLSNDGGNNFVYGMDGDDTILLSGGDDFIWGGKGDDLIQTGGGSDIIYYELGDGNDTIDDTTGRGTYPYSGYDVVFLGEGILPDEVHVTFGESKYEFVLHIVKTGETITLPGNMYSGVSAVFPIEEIRFTDGTAWDRIKLLELTKTLYGTDGDDEITFIQDGDAAFLKTYDGCGTIYGYDGDDRIFGAGGNDYICGGKGDDYMRGGSGDDTFYYELGDGNDMIDMGNGKGSYPQGGNNILVFGEGILPDEITVERSYDDYSYTLWINKTGESVTMTGNVVSGVSNCFPIKEFHFADGTVWMRDYLEENYVKYIRGTDGNDSLNDSGSDDTVFCGRGNDYIRGKGGDDLYIYEAGDGRDTIQDAALFGNGYNTLRFGEGIAPDDLYTEKTKYNGYDMIRFYIKDRSNYVQVSGIHEIVFADGTKLLLADAQKEAKPASGLTSELAGDLSCDGRLTAADVELLTDYLSTFADLRYWEIADLNQDGILNAADLSMLKNLVIDAKES